MMPFLQSAGRIETHVDCWLLIAHRGYWEELIIDIVVSSNIGASAMDIG